MSAHTPGPWFVRYCDDAQYMCMTVISSKDHGPSNDGQYDGAKDTVAIVYHQSAPLVAGDYESSTDVDERDANANLIAAAPAGLKAAELAYAALIAHQHDTWRLQNQHVYCDLRNFIAKAKGLSEKEVQDAAESAGLARVGGAS